MTHQWSFFRSGGFDQVQLDSIEDWKHLSELDTKLWVALSCPVKGIEFDPRTLAFLDADKDGRIRIDEVKTAVAWALSMLQQPEVLLSGNSLPLSAINIMHADGQRLLASAKSILHNLGKPDANCLTVKDTADLSLIFPPHELNGDGIVTAQQATTEPVKQLIQKLLALGICATDRSGEKGVNQSLLDQFVTDATAMQCWLQKGGEIAEQYGEDLAEIYQAYEFVAPKVTDFFTRCQLVAYDATAAKALNGAEEDYLHLSRSLLTQSSLAGSLLPLAQVNTSQRLPLQQGVHPHWANSLLKLKQHMSIEWANRDDISLQDWLVLEEKLEPYSLWLKAKPPVTAASILTPEELAEYLNATTLDQVKQLIDNDAAQKNEAESVLDVDKLVRYQVYLRDLLRNFINFANFYNLKESAIFQMGRLYIDGRSCDLCLTVNDAARHAKLASLSGIYLLYLDCVRLATGEKTAIVAAMTAGDSGNLMVGRNAVFYDNKGNDWDATVTQIVSNPISIHEAFFTPYQRIGRILSEQIQKFAASKDKEIEVKSVEGVKKLDPLAAAKPVVPFDVAKFAGIFAAIGLAIGAIGTAIAAVLTSFLSLTWWQMPLALLGVIVFISGPSMILAWFKLRARNLAPLLDANGWAINSNAKISLTFGAKLTAVATIPLGSNRSLIDPYEQQGRKRYWVLLLIVILAGAIWQVPFDLSTFFK